MAYQGKKLINHPNGSACHPNIQLLVFPRVDFENSCFYLTWVVDVVTEYIEGLVATYPGLQYLDGFPQVTYNFSFYSLKI
jgi:hypothetical protein